jgi:hypothetical protein
VEHPLPYRDTDPRAMEVWLDLQRKMPAGDKIAAVLAASRFVLQMYEAGVRSQHPHADDREVFLRTAARHLSRDLMIQVYGWDPQQHEDSGGRV